MSIKQLASRRRLCYNEIMNCIFIYNPYSKRGKIAEKLPYIVKKLKTKYEEVDVYATKARGDLTDKVREVAGKYDCIVFSGGDGTFHEILSGIGDMEKLPLLGYIPGGTANDIAHSLGIPRKSIRGALNVILKGRRELLDCMRVNGRDYVMYVIAAGAFTSATYTTRQEAKRALGYLAYGIEGARKNLRFRVFPVKATANDASVESEAVLSLIMNSKCVGGWKLNRKGSMRDGKLESVIVKQKVDPGFFRRVKALFAVVKLFLFGCRFKQRDIESVTGSRFHFEVPEDVVWNFDGERGASGSIDVELIPDKVPMLVPKNNKNI